MRRVAISQAGQTAGLVALLLAAIWILWTELRPPATAANQPRHSIAITAAPLAGAGSKIGPFRLTSAAVLTSPETSFGGLSGLAALPDGRLLAVTDAGDWLLFRPGAPSGEMGSISMPGDVKSDRDAEAIVFTPDGRTLISLEQQHRILGFAGHGPPLTPAGEPLYRTDTMGWPPNGGGESLAVLGDGSLIWIAENVVSANGARTALLVAPSGSTRRIMIDGVDGFAPTDAVALDETHLLVLHRRFTGAETAAAISIGRGRAIVRVRGARSTSCSRPEATPGSASDRPHSRHASPAEACISTTSSGAASTRPSCQPSRTRCRASATSSVMLAATGAHPSAARNRSVGTSRHWPLATVRSEVMGAFVGGPNR